jgi:hypothetical protein
MAEDLKLKIMTVRVMQGTFDRMDRLLKGGELRSTFIRKAVEAEIAHRADNDPRDLRKHPASEIHKAIGHLEAELKHRRGAA